MLANRDQPFLVALADAGQVVLVEMQIGGADADQLRDAHARRVQQFDHGAVAQPARRRDIRCGDERVDLLDGEEPGQRRPGGRPAEIVGRALIQAAIEHEKAVVAPDRGDRSRDGPRREPARHALADERFEGLTVERLGVALRRRRKRGQRPQIARVALQGMAGEPAFDTQVIEVEINHGIRHLRKAKERHECSTVFHAGPWRCQPGRSERSTRRRAELRCVTMRETAAGS